MAKFLNRLIVSCQDNPAYSIPHVVQAGAGGLRVEGSAGVKTAREAAPGHPIIACWKEDVPGTEVRITPLVTQAVELASMGAEYVAFDATARERPYPVAAMINAIHLANALAVADVATLEEATTALRLGADVIATTLAADMAAMTAIIKALAGTTQRYLLAEGGLRTPWQARMMLRHGADGVCIGSAITRPGVITRWFAEGIEL